MFSPEIEGIYFPKSNDFIHKLEWFYSQNQMNLFSKSNDFIPKHLMSLFPKI